MEDNCQYQPIIDELQKTEQAIEIYWPNDNKHGCL